MNNIDIEKLTETITEGKEFLKNISHIHPKEIKHVLENVYEMYKHNFSECLRDKYNSNRVFDIVYDKDDNIIYASLTWNYFDTGEITLKCTGIEVIYTPENGSQKITAELSWKVVNPYFNEFLN